VLAWLLVRRGQFALDAGARRTVPRFVLATSFMVAVLWAVQPHLVALGQGLPMRGLMLALLLGTGGLSYLAAARALGLFTVKGLAARLKRNTR
jgi:putative peptidoglycan lipid II flippase